MAAFWAEMDSHTLYLILLGTLLSLSIFVDALARRTNLPRISLLVLVGATYSVVQQGVLGEPYALPLGELSEPLINLAVVMVAFLLGGELTLAHLKRSGLLILMLSLSVTLIGALTVGAGLILLGYPMAIAISLAAIAVATDPAAVSETIRSHGHNGRRSRILLGIVALNDAWGIIVFGVAMAFLGWFIASESGADALFHAGWDLGGALMLGAALGLPAAWLTGRLQPGQPTLVEALALILLITGLASMFQVSALLTAMVAGAVIVNLSSHHERSFSEVEHIEWPFLIFFFVLSGASLNLQHMQAAAGLIVAYILLRLAGRYLGGSLGVVVLARRPQDLPSDMGLALTPQAGITMGMALLAAERFPDVGYLIVATVVTSTIVFEMFGPLLVKRVLKEKVPRGR